MNAKTAKSADQHFFAAFATFCVLRAIVIALDRAIQRIVPATRSVVSPHA